MLEELKHVNAVIGEVNSLLVSVFVPYLIVLGLAFRKGKSSWAARENARRKTRGLPVVTLASQKQASDYFWKDPDLIQSGLIALSIIGILFSYVIIMLLFGFLMGGYSQGDAVFKALAIYTMYPVLMSSFFLAMIILGGIRFQVLKIMIPVWIASAAFAVGGGYILHKGYSPKLQFALEVGVTMLQAILLSYSIGMVKGLAEASVEDKYPLVDVETLAHGIMAKVWLFDKSDMDYRFLSAAGEEIIIPIQNVFRLIRRP